jgi:hypothetical protein
MVTGLKASLPEPVAQNYGVVIGIRQRPSETRPDAQHWKQASRNSHQPYLIGIAVAGHRNHVADIRRRLGEQVTALAPLEVFRGGHADVRPPDSGLLNPHKPV